MATDHARTERRSDAQEAETRDDRSGRLGWRVLRGAARDFVEDRVMTLAAALAFYTSLSLAPLLLVLLWALSFVGAGGEDYLLRRAERLAGADARNIVESVLASADGGGFAGPLSLGLLLLGATAVFAQLQISLNTLWEVEARPGAGVWGWVRKRLLSLGMVGILALLLLISLAADTAVDALRSRIDLGVPPQVFSLLANTVVFTLLFAVVFRFLPDVIIAWRDVWAGAGVTAVLFALGKYAIGMYLARRAFGGTYGAGGSIVAVLVWVYYSSILVFFGAELTQEWAHQRGRRLVPDRHAVRVARRKEPAPSG